MRCKKHFTDSSSIVGVCASCLRERLWVLIAAQTQYNQAQQVRWPADADTDTDTDPPPVVFPRSVSPPYVFRRKSDCSIDFKLDRRGVPDHRFYSTPQVGPNGKIQVIASAGSVSYRRKKFGLRFSLLAKLFGSKSEKQKPDVSGSGRDPSVVDGFSTSWPSLSWFGKIFPGRRRTFSVDESTIGGDRGVCRVPDKGMLPARYAGEEDEHCNHRSSGSSSECSRPWNETPKRTPAWATPGKRGGSGKPGHSQSVSGFGFCLNPLVRASPSRHWNNKGIPPEMIVSGDIRVVPVKPPPCNAAALCKNRSRKLADIGRFRQNR